MTTVIDRTTHHLFQPLLYQGERNPLLTTLPAAIAAAGVVVPSIAVA
jgi:hypothetical protein